MADPGSGRLRLSFFQAPLRVEVSGGVPVQPELVILRRQELRTVGPMLK
ncbi:MAG: hypothetical protein LC130_24405 [Bryobacterales bacterium]|nr:hypothetical protein [Bryobacterales bacterium]